MLRDKTTTFPKQRLLKLFLVPLALLLLWSAFCACTRADRNPVGLPETTTIACAILPETALVQVAQAQGFYGKEALVTTITSHHYGKLALNEMLAGKADFATVAETPFAFAALKGERVAVIATIHSSHLGHAILARRDRGILSPGELKGKKIAATLGTTSHFFLDTMLVANGVSRKEVEVVDLKAELIPEALLRGDIDAASLFSPFLELAQKQLGDRAISFRDKDVYRYTFNVVTTADVIQKSPGKVTKMLRALLRAEEFARENPEEAQKIVSEFSGIAMDTIRATWLNANFSVILDQSLLLALEDESQWAINNRLTTALKVPNYLDYIYLDGLKAVKADAVRILR
jgi:NitT/TauT family transport system substrate-binding protein